MCPPETDCLQPDCIWTFFLKAYLPSSQSYNKFITSPYKPLLPAFTLCLPHVSASKSTVPPLLPSEGRRSAPTSVKAPNSIKVHYELLSHSSRRNAGQRISETARKQMTTLNKSQGCLPSGDSQLFTNHPCFLLIKR